MTFIAKRQWLAGLLIVLWLGDPALAQSVDRETLIEADISAETASLDEALLSVQQGLGMAKIQLRDQEFLIEPIASIGHQSEQLTLQWMKQRDDLSEQQRVDYAKLMSHYAGLLRTASEIEDPEEAHEILNYVDRELTIKTLRASPNEVWQIAPRDRLLGGFVEVTVRTIENQTEVHGYIVSCNPMRYRNRQTPMYVFDDLSSPTARKVPAGKYEFVITQNDRIRGRRHADIGFTGQLHQRITVPIEEESDGEP